MCDLKRSLYAAIVASTLFSGNVLTDESNHLIRGTVIIDTQSASSRPPNERLVLKFYYPEDGIEKDLTYRIYKNYSFPFEFHDGPDLDMSRRTKWSSYVVEAFTDLDGDVTSISKNEIHASSEVPISIGSDGVFLKLLDSSN